MTANHAAPPRSPICTLGQCLADVTRSSRRAKRKHPLDSLQRFSARQLPLRRRVVGGEGKDAARPLLLRGLGVVQTCARHRKHTLPIYSGAWSRILLIMLVEVLGGFVAAGTLALAGVTGWMAVATRAMVRESSRARLDALAPNITVLQLKVEKAPVRQGPSADAPTVDVPPGTLWSMAKDGDARIGVRASGVLVNEGATSAQLKLLAPPEVEIQHVVADYIEGPGASGPPPVLTKQGDYWMVRPHMRVNSGFILWKSAQWWAERSNGSGRDAAPVLGHVDVEVTSAAAAVVDSCRLSFGMLPFVRHPTDDGWVVAGSQRYSGPAPARADIGPMVRTYPSR